MLSAQRRRFGKPIEGVTKKTGQIRFQTNEPRDIQVLIDIIYFPGWNIYIDGEEKDFTLRNYLISINIPKGPHTIELLFENTPIRTAGNTLSLLSTLIVFLILTPKIQLQTVCREYRIFLFRRMSTLMRRQRHGSGKKNSGE